MKKIRAFMIVCVFLSWLPVVALAGSIEGTIQGFMCVTQGKVCPIGQEDPMIAAENIFVLLTDSGRYYFVLNLQRTLMARHINKKIKFDGKLDEKYDAITVSAIYFWKDNDWKKGWDIEWLRSNAFPGFH